MADLSDPPVLVFDVESPDGYRVRLESLPELGDLFRVVVWKDGRELAQRVGDEKAEKAFESAMTWIKDREGWRGWRRIAEGVRVLDFAREVQAQRDKQLN
jgi:hypothetical protein